MGAGMGAFDDAAPGAGDRSPKPQASSSASPPAAGPSPSKNGLPMPSSGNGGGDLLDLEDIFGGGGGSAPAAAVPPAAAAAAAAPGAGNGASAPAGGVDLLADVFGGGGGLVPSKAAPANTVAAGVPVPVAAAPVVGGDSDDFGGFEVAPPREDKMVVSERERDRTSMNGVTTVDADRTGFFYVLSIFFVVSYGAGVSPVGIAVVVGSLAV